MKTEEELNALKKEVENLNKKLAELSDEELAAVTGGNSWNEYWGEDGYFRNPLRSGVPTLKESADSVTMHNMPKINPDEKYVMTLIGGSTSSE